MVSTASSESEEGRLWLSHLNAVESSVGGAPTLITLINESLSDTRSGLEVANSGEAGELAMGAVSADAVKRQRLICKCPRR
jgi:hypothetical protein